MVIPVGHRRLLSAEFTRTKLEMKMKYLDRIANIAVIVGVLVFLGLAYRGDFALHKVAQAPSQDLAGTTVSLPGAQLPRDRDSLLLVVSTTCHFCKDSLPFYKQLTEKSRGRLNIVAVLPQPQSDAQKFLSDAGVAANQIVSASLNSQGVRGTPTVLLVDGTGKVKHAWVGRLDEKGQENLLAIVFPTTPS